MTHKWTAQATECYNNGSDCRLCSVPKLGLDSLEFTLKDGEIETNCGVKNVVPEILAKLGPPQVNVKEALNERFWHDT